MGELIEGPWPQVEARPRRHLTLVVDNTSQSCHDCVNATFGSGGTFCTEFNEWIDNEETAGDDCPLFIRDE